MSHFSSQICDSVKPYRDVRRIQFGILSPDEIRRMSVTEPSIKYPDLYETGTGKAKLNGLADPRQGPLDRNSKCLTCFGSYNECSGHFGHIELVKPVYHVAFLTKVLKILRCVCFYCSKLLIDSNDPQLIQIIKSTKNQRHRRLAYIVDKFKNRKKYNVSKSTEETTDQNDAILNQLNCCGHKQPIYRRSGLGLTIKWEGTTVESQEIDSKLTAAKVHEILKFIPNSVCEILGIDPRQSRPEWMIITVLPVPPLCVRPSVLLFGTARCQDDLTYNLARIINANNTLSEAEQCSASPHIIDKYWQDLQTSCATLINNDISGMPKLTQKDGRPLKSLTERLKGKEGRIRGNIMGKRVDFSARSVITADPNLAIDQVGVPQSIAQNLTVPEMVTPYNKDWLQELIIRRVAKHIILEDGSRINLKYHPCPSDISLQYGYIVERQMMDDDLVVFNRQPSLHKMSMMAHRVKILPWSTFRLNLSVTTPYNADFDGDEMNLHLPQSLEARAELAQLMTVPRLLITPQSNRPVMGIVQDTLTAVTKMTRRDVFIDKNELMNLLMHIPSWNGKIPPATILKPKPLWTGKQLISLLLPRQVNCIRTRSDEKDEQSFEWISPSDSKLLVENGQLLSGILCTQTLGPNAGSLGHIIFMECGHDVAGKFYSSMQLLVNHWLLIEGHSVGISDTIIDETTTEIIHHRIEQSEYEVQKLITDIRTKQSSLSFFSRQSFENTINEHLNKVRNEAGSLAQKSLTNFNQFKAMVDSGAKGKALNIFQIIVCVGQQNVEGKRIPFGFKGRTLPHFLQDDYGAKAHGFVKKSYLQGLTPAEFFFHAMGGREGLIDTAIKTAETGYIQRRLVKAMESVMVKYDGTVRNQNEHIIQFVYGEDGLAGENVEFQSILSLQPADISFQNLCKFDLPNKKEDLQQFLNSNIINDLFSNEESLQVLNNEWEQLCQDRKHLREIFPRGDNSRIVLPCNIARLIHNARKLFHISKQTQSNLSPIKLIQDLNNLTERLTVIKGTDSISHEAQYNATLLMNILVRSSLCSKQILQEHHLTSEAFDWLCGEIETRFQQAQVQPGEMVGVLAAQSIGEPATQMTLNTFHYAGVSAKNVTLGVPRLKEIINLSKNPKTPSMTIFPDVHVDNNDSHTYAQIISRLENCTLKHITLNSKVYYDPDPRTTVIQEDQNWINDYNELPDSNHLQTSPWLLRIELDQRKICHKFLTMEEVVEKLPRKLFDCEGEDDLHVIYSDDNADHLVLHIRLVDKPKTMSDNENISEEDKSTQLDDDSLLRFLDTEVFANLTLKGNKSISKAYRVETKTFAPNDWRKRFIISGEGTMKASDEHCVVTNGSAFQYALTMKGIDYRRTYTNDVIEVFCVLGVEAVRKAIEYELNHVLSYDGAYVNHRHLSLLCDVMTTKGHLLPITRHGINRQDFSPIMRSSFEETVGVFIDAAANAEFDALKGVSESIALGQLAKIGTGTFDLFVDMKKCPLAMEVLTTNISTVSGYDTPSLVSTTPWIKSIATTPSYHINTSPITTATSTLNTNFTYVPTSPSYTSYQSQYSSTTPSYYNPTSPSYNSMMSPNYSTGSTSPYYASISPSYRAISPSYTSSSYSNPSYSPTSPGIPRYSPKSPIYSPSFQGLSPYSPASSIYQPNIASPLDSRSSTNTHNAQLDDTDDLQ